MTSLLVLAQELFERATNPAYGVAANDEFAARLSAAIGPEDIERFASEVARLDDPAAFTSYGWAWVLEFAAGHRVTLRRELLTALCQRWDEPALKALVVEAALGDEVVAADQSQPGDQEWLDGVIELAAPLPTPTDDTLDDYPVNDDHVRPGLADEPGADRTVDTSSAEALVTALLVIGTDPAVAGAQRLLNRSWPGTEQLAEFVDARLRDPDPLARLPWEQLRR
jgi:hypothetical protein